MSTLVSPDVTWYPVPKGNDVCPRCEGTGLLPLSEKDLTYSWNKGKTHYGCTNCGGQTMSGKALGYTKIDPNTGKGCLHSFVGRNAGRCYTVYDCKNGCGYRYDIDSGD